LKAGFVTERQLEDGLVPEASVLLVPDIVHFSSAALATLRKFKGRLVLVGKDDVLKADEYGHARSLDLTVARIPFNHGTIVNLCNQLNVPVSVTLVRAGHRATARDVLSGARLDGPMTLAPLEVRLLRLERYRVREFPSER
jgi:hypothetical protein